MKAWILGAQGLVGKNLVKLCQKQGIEVIFSGREELDITDFEALRKKAEEIRPTHLFNCAAYTNVDLAEKEDERAFRVNALAPGYLGILGRIYSIRVIHVSTDYVFDGEKKEGYQESDHCRPLSLYGKSKQAGENRLLEELPSACIVRTSWVFGGSGKNFISSILERFKSQEQLRVNADQISRPTFAPDLAEALLLLAGQSGIFHFANGHPLSRYQIACDFLKKAKELNLPIRCQTILPINTNDLPLPAARPFYSALSTEKISKLLGRQPRTWETILEEYVRETV